MKYIIKKSYKIFEESQSEPMHETDEKGLFGWLQGRGMSEAEAQALIKTADFVEEIAVNLPKT